MGAVVVLLLVVFAVVVTVGLHVWFSDRPDPHDWSDLVDRLIDAEAQR